MDIFLQIIFGLISGVLGGMGMGGGTLLIPLLTIFLNIEQKVAQGVNLIVFIPMAIVSLIIHTKNKLVDYKVGLFIIITGLVTSVLCALLASNLSNDSLKLYFGIFLTALGLFQGISAFFMKEGKKLDNKKEKWCVFL